jgi:ABC-type lipoprotein release transport system permease subunit
MSALFAAVALVASFLPARRAAAADPVAALRAD